MGAKSRLWRLLVRFLCAYSAPWRLGAALTAHGNVEVLQPPPAPGPLKGPLQPHSPNFVNLQHNLAQATALQRHPRKTSFLPVLLRGVPSQFQCQWRKAPPWQNRAAQPLFAPPDIAWQGWPGLQQNQFVCWSKYLGRVQLGPCKHI